MEKELKSVFEGNLQERKWKADVFFISAFTSERSSCLYFVGFGEFYFQFVVKLWYFGVNKYGLVCSKVTECLLSGWWDGHEKGKVKGEKPSLRRAVA